jgi:hypothetical protein
VYVWVVWTIKVTECLSFAGPYKLGRIHPVKSLEACSVSLRRLLEKGMSAAADLPLLGLEAGLLMSRLLMDMSRSGWF